jgi:gliding motility-associated-like protein
MKTTDTYFKTFLLMYKREARFLTIALFLCVGFLQTSASAQVEVRVTVTGGTANTSCIDILSPPDPFWRVNVENTGWFTYPRTTGCFTALPHVPYTANYDCPADVPASLQLCFRAFENDGLPFTCQILESCSETICQNFIIPSSGTVDYTLSLPLGLSSSGSVNFNISSIQSPLVQYNSICTPLHLGQLNFGETLGDASQGIYHNRCADGLNEPNPVSSVAGWNNEYGVWFTFTTGPDPGTLLILEARDDPQQSGDNLDTQIAVYTASTPSCTGPFQLLRAIADWSNPDCRLDLWCPSPNTTYYVLIDGDFIEPGGFQGTFGFQVRSVPVPEASDTPCGAEHLGEVPQDGFVSTTGLRANFCATSVNDPFVPAFSVQASVWFSFAAPPSGHVIIEGISDTEISPWAIQLALFASESQTCNGPFVHLASRYDGSSLNEEIQISCLYPGQTYWVMFDGFGDGGRGLFDLRVRDAGDITPISNQEITICAGDTLIVGDSRLTSSGNFSTRINLFAGCDSIVNTTLMVLPELSLTVAQQLPAFGAGVPNGSARATAAGGVGSFSYMWCNGESGPIASALPGNQFCTVTVTDAYGCSRTESVFIDQVSPLQVVASGDTLLCAGDSNGEIRFQILEGWEPFSFNWQRIGGGPSGQGTMISSAQPLSIDNLPAGSYSIIVNDIFSADTIFLEISEPPALVITQVSNDSASCFGVCDGAIQLSVIGGTGAYQLAWNGQQAANYTMQGLCAGNYQWSVTDDNLCQAILPFEIGQPIEFIATATLVRPVSCYEGSDGETTVGTNGSPIAFLWSNGSLSQNATGLSSGFYFVTITNFDGCRDTTGIQVPQPPGPVGAIISVSAPVSCHGGSDGILAGQATGPGQNFVLSWSNGIIGTQNPGLSAGYYALIVRNELGCTGEASLDFGEPDPISANFEIEDLNCINIAGGGAIFIEDIRGGTGFYRFALDGGSFVTSPIFTGLAASSYNLRIQDTPGCVFTFPVIVQPPPDIQVSIGEDQTILLGETLNLIAETNSPGARFYWKSSEGETFPDAQRLEIAPTFTAAYTVTVIDTLSGCSATDVITVLVDKTRRVFIPDAFSPNGDGINDTFHPFGGSDVRRIRQFQIFDRFGAQIFKAADFSPGNPELGWDGKFRGSPLSPGVYVWMAEIEFVDGVSTLFRGEIMLLR